jgi:secreted PhoX family phosphatase
MNSRIVSKRKFFVFSAVALAVAAALSACDSTTTSGKTLTGVEFTDTPAPATNADMVSATTTSKAIYHYSDGSSVEYPLSYNVLYKNTDKIGFSATEAARLYDVSGNALLDANGDPVVAETPDANTFLTVGGKHYLVTHYEYDWKLADNSGSPSRMPMSMTVTELSQNASSGALTAVAQSPVDFSGVAGLWIPCAGGPSPWNTHLGSEEDYDLYFVNSDGTPGTTASAGLTAMTEKYFNSAASANPYDYGYIPEVTVAADGSSSVVKHYSMGRGTWELTRVMPDNRTAYFGDDGTNVGLFMYVADTAADLSAGTLYAAKWTQTSADNGGAATLTWVKLGHATDAEVKAIIDAGTVFTDIFDITTPALTPTWEADGYKAIRAGQSSTEYLRLKAGKEQAAAFLESRRYAAYLGATTEFNKMEGVAVNAKDKIAYLAMSYIDKGMKADATGPVDDIQLAKLNAGATYALTLSSGQNDTNANPIDSAWVATAMSVPAALLGEDITVDALGNTANPAKVANPDNLFFAEKMRTLFIGEDSGTHVNNFIWAYNVDTGKLSRILSQPSGAEATGLVVHENLNGHAYIGANNQHQGEWLGSMPTAVRDALLAEATTRYGVNAYGTPNYYLEANVGYIGGMPGL